MKQKYSLGDLGNFIDMVRDELILDVKAVQIDLFNSSDVYTFKNGLFSGESFVNVSNLDRNLFLDGLYSKTLITHIRENFERYSDELDILNERYKDEFRGNKELFGREYSDDNRQFGYDESKLSRDDERGGVNQNSNKQSEADNGHDKYSNERGDARDGSVGSFEQDVRLQSGLNDQEVIKNHLAFKRLVNGLKGDYPELSKFGYHNILKGKNKDIIIKESRLVGEFDRVIDFSLFGIDFNGQSVDAFRVEIEQVKKLDAKSVIEYDELLESDYVVNEYDGENYRIYDDGSVGRVLKDGSLTTMNLTKEIDDAIRLNAGFGLDNNLDYSNFHSGVLGVVKANYVKKLDSYYEQEDMMVRGDMPTNEHTLKSFTERSNNLFVFEQKYNLKRIEKDARRVNQRKDTKYSDGDSSKQSVREDRQSRDGEDRSRYDGDLSSEFSNLQESRGSDNGNDNKSSYEDNELDNPFDELVNSGVFNDFEHTRSGEMLKVFKFSDKVDKETFKSFSNYLKLNKIGYYSRFAKGFIVTDNDFLSKYEALENDRLSKSEVNVEKGDLFANIGDMGEEELSKFFNENIEEVERNSDRLSDVLDSKIGSRATAVADALGFLDDDFLMSDKMKSDWLDNVSFVTDTDGINNVSSVIFGVKDEFKDLDVFLEEVRGSEQYKDYIKNDLVIKEVYDLETLLELYNGAEYNQKSYKDDYLEFGLTYKGVDYSNEPHIWHSMIYDDCISGDYDGVNFIVYSNKYGKQIFSNDIVEKNLLPEKLYDAIVKYRNEHIKIINSELSTKELLEENNDDEKAHSINEFNTIIDEALKIKNIDNSANEDKLVRLFEDLNRHPIGIYEPLKNEKVYNNGINKVQEHINSLLNTKDNETSTENYFTMDDDAKLIFLESVLRDRGLRESNMKYFSESLFRVLDKKPLDKDIERVIQGERTKVLFNEITNIELDKSLKAVSESVNQYIYGENKITKRNIIDRYSETTKEDRLEFSNFLDSKFRERKTKLNKLFIRDLALMEFKSRGFKEVDFTQNDITKFWSRADIFLDEYGSSTSSNYNYIIGLNIFGVKDEFKDINEYIDKIKSNDGYKKFIDKYSNDTLVNYYKSPRYEQYKDEIKNIHDKKELKELNYKINDEYSKNFVSDGGDDKFSELQDLKGLVIHQFEVIDDELVSFDKSKKLFCEYVNKDGVHDAIGLEDRFSEFWEIGKTQSMDDFKGFVEEYQVLKYKSSNDNKTDENFTIDDDIDYGGAKTKFKNYIAGIDVLRKVERDEAISREDKVKLSKMPGLGTIASAFYRNDGSVSKGWEKEAELLKDVLSEQEYEDGQKTVLDAYYTDEKVAKAMWKGLERFGFQGGSVLEPSVGVGNFFGYMPKNLKTNTALMGVEIDKTTSKVAQILYPKAKIFNVGYEEFSVLNGAKPNVIIGNPPYGSHKINDESNNELDGKNIHNYFMGKSIDNLDNGGVMAMVVSSSFLDAKDSSTREYIGKNANLIGAIRLPKGSFSNANTEVVTDIVFIQKVENSETNINLWNELGSVNDTPCNKYFENNPQNMLGEWGKFSTMYRGDEAGLVARDDQDTDKLLDDAINNLPTFYVGNNTITKYTKTVAMANNPDTIEPLFNLSNSRELIKSLLSLNGEKIATNARINSYFINDDILYKRLADVNGEHSVLEVKTKVNSSGKEVNLTNKEIDKIKSMVVISDIATKLRVAQLDDDTRDFELDSLRVELNSEYDKFVKKFGYLNNGTNKRLFEDDVNSPFILALEKKYNKGISKTIAKRANIDSVAESASKADIFFQRTQSPYEVPKSAESYKDALNICLSEKAFIDLGYMSKLLDKGEDDICNYLSDNDLIYDDPHDGWVTKEEYLSGNVKEKLEYTDNEKNLDALKGVIPKDIEAIDINVSCGASWIPKSDMIDFIEDISSNRGNCYYDAYNANWNFSSMVSFDSDKESLYGTSRKRAKDILLAALNGKQIVIKDTIDSGDDARSVVNEDETTAANDKVDLIKEKWNDWIFEDGNRRDRLSRLYNDKFNVYAKRVYDGSHLSLPNKVGDDVIDLRPHQKNGVWRVLQDGKGLFDHTVGSGKTFTAIASVMELKRTGKAKKPLVVVPNHLVGQWAKEWLELYPNANLLVPSKKDFSAKNRKLMMSRMATGEYDAIIIAHSQLGKIENDKDFEAKFIKDEISEIQNGIDLIRRENSLDSRSVKNMIKTKINLESKLDRLLKGDKDDNIGFLELGVDAMVVDEAHEFKNLQFHTSMQRIRGLGNPAGSKKAFDMYVKTQALLEKTNGKNLIFLTGTPISNSIAEMFTVQRYMMSDELKKSGLNHFDAWVKQNAEILTDWELTASGKYKLTTRMSKFKNMPELMGAYNNFADVITTDMVKEMLAKQGKSLDVPAVKGNKPKNVIVDRSDDQAEFIGIEDSEGKYEEGCLVYRSENMPKGKPKKGDDNMLVVMSDARKASLDMRLIDSSYEDFESSKVNKSIDDMLDIYKKWDDLKGVQLIFCDLSTPKSAIEKEKIRINELVKAADLGNDAAIKELEKISSDDLDVLNSNFSVYDDIKKKLIDSGIDESEIAFIHDANTDKQKEDLFYRVNSGDIRFLLGSTSKMGAGMNVQKRLVGLHHLDVPWRPSDLEQREGRIIRQGNLISKLYGKLGEYNFELDALRGDKEFNNLIDNLGLEGDLLDGVIKDAKLSENGFEVEINRYATSNTLDSGLWEKIEAKARFIEQIKAGDIINREVEDISGESANAAEMKAASSGNPLILEEMKLKNEIKKLKAIKKNFKRTLFDNENTISYYERFIDSFDDNRAKGLIDKGLVDRYRGKIDKDIEAFKVLKEQNKANGVSYKGLVEPSGFKGVINGIEYVKRADFGSAILDNRGIGIGSEKEIGEFAGFKMNMGRDRFSNYFITLSGENEYSFDFDIKKSVAGGLATKVNNLLDNINWEYRKLLENYDLYKDELVKLKGLDSRFSREDELVELKGRYKDVINQLKSKDKSKGDKVVGDEHKKSVKSSVINNWVDENIGVDSLDLLGDKVKLDVLDRLGNYEFSGNCLVLHDSLDRKDYLEFKKVFEVFGGKWDKKLDAVVFSNDGVGRIRGVLGDLDNGLDVQEEFDRVIDGLEVNDGFDRGLGERVV